MITTTNLTVLCPFQEKATPSPLSFHPASTISKKRNLLEYILSTNLLFSICCLATSHFDFLLPSRIYVDDHTAHHENRQFHFSNLLAMPFLNHYYPCPQVYLCTNYLTLLHVKKTTTTATTSPITIKITTET